MTGRKRHHDPIHEGVNEDAVDWTGEKWLARHEGELAADDVKNGGGGEGYEVMNSQTERGRGNSAVERFIAEKACGDSAEKAGGLHSFGVPGDERGGNIHASAEETGPENSGVGAGMREIVSDELML